MQGMRLIKDRQKAAKIAEFMFQDARVIGMIPSLLTPIRLFFDTDHIQIPSLTDGICYDMTVGAHMNTGLSRLGNHIFNDTAPCNLPREKGAALRVKKFAKIRMQPIRTDDQIKIVLLQGRWTIN